MAEMKALSPITQFEGLRNGMKNTRERRSHGVLVLGRVTRETERSQGTVKWRCPAKWEVFEPVAALRGCGRW